MTIILDTGNALTDLMLGIINGLINVIPGVIAAIVVLIVGYFVGKFLGYLVQKILVKAKIADFISRKIASMGDFDIPHFFGAITKWYVFILFLGASASLVKMPILQSFLLSLSYWIPNLILAVIIVFIGIAVGDYIYEVILKTKANSARVIASFTRIIIIVFVSIIGLNQAGINIRLAENSFLIMLSGIVVAFAIAFGVALKDEAKNMIKHVKSMNKPKKR